MKRLPAAFFALSSGREPVRDWLKALPAAVRKAIGEDIKDVEFSWPIGMPLCRSLGGGLWEVRSDLPLGGRIARVLFCAAMAGWFCCTVFIKKSQKTPSLERDVAIRRMKALE